MRELEPEAPYILIVDDKPQNLLALESILENFDIQIVKATSGEEALWKILEHEFFLIIMDVQMPEMDGFETAELIRARTKTKHTPIIYLSAISKEQKHVFRGYEAGAVDYLFKPIEEEILKSKVRVFLDLYKQQKVIEKQTLILQENKKELERKHYIQSVINTLLHVSLEIHSLEEMLDRMLDQIVSVPWLALKSTGAIFLADEKTDELVLTSYRELSEDVRLRCKRVPFGRCICGKTAATKKIQFVDCINDSHEVKSDEMVPHGHYCIPIMSADKLLGVLNLCLKQGHVYNKEDETFLTAIANVMAGSISRKQIEKQLQYEAIHDSLTGVYNRRFFIKRLTEFVNSAKRYDHNLSVCLCDLDKFKEINDTYGHKVGDEVLMVFSNIVKEELRNVDIGGRYGGDEFCIIFNNTPASDAVKCVERIRLCFQKEGSKIIGGGSASATFGIADFKSTYNNEKDLLSAADQALYQAKEAGRNCTVVLKDLPENT